METTPSQTHATAKILIIDDEPSNIRGLIHLLEREGYKQCVGYTDPAVAVADFLTVTPDVLLLDWHMESMNGLEVIKALHAKFADSFIPPVIVLTADCCPETKKEALAAGASDFLSKPFDQSEVLLRIDNLLRLRHLVGQMELEKGRLEEIVFERTSELRQTIDELKAVQQQVIEQERMRALAAMAGGVAHDFNNSLMVIRGFSEMYGSAYMKRTSPVEMQDAFDAIALAARDAGEIVRRLREFYQPFSDPEELRCSVSLNRIIKEGVELTRPKWETQTRALGICVSVDLELLDDPRVFVTPAEIREILINLVFNAVDAMPQGGEIVVRSRTENDQVLIEVEDSGTGMTEVTRQRCLEPFYTTKGERGTGLGLAIVYGVLHRYEGSIRIKSELNHGTCITVCLPLATEAVLDVPTAPAIAGPQGLRVLMVDDEPLICSIMTHLLKTDDHTVTLAGNGCEALEKFNAQDFDVVITDRVMPKMSGDQLAMAIRRRKPEAPIILLTGYDTRSIPRDVNLSLSKPATIESLRAALATAVSGNHPRKVHASNSSA